MTDTKKYLIEPIELSDETLLWEMLYLAIYVPPGVFAPDRDIVHTPELSRYVEGWGKEGDLGVKVLTSDGQADGAAWLRLLTGKNRGYGYIDDETPELGIAIVEEHRGKGIGTQLLKHLFEQARGMHAAVSLSVSKDNPALRLYRRFGFEVVADNCSSLTMKKELMKYGDKNDPY
jgi:GNAT superfamily N-acetyltransferase